MWPEKAPWSHLSGAAAAKSLQSCPTLRDPMDCSLPGSCAHGIFQARVLEWGAIAFSSGEEVFNHQVNPLPSWASTPREKAMLGQDWGGDPGGRWAWVGGCWAKPMLGSSCPFSEGHPGGWALGRRKDWGWGWRRGGAGSRPGGVGSRGLRSHLRAARRCEVWRWGV